MAFCTQCGASAGDDVRFCTACGAALQAAPVSPLPEPEPHREVPTPHPGPKPEPQPFQPEPPPPPAMSEPARTPVQLRSPEPQPNAGRSGRPRRENPAPRHAPPAQSQQPAPQFAVPMDRRCSVLGTGAYIGAMLLLALPVIGLILGIIWACGGSVNFNRRNLARAYLILLLAALVLCAILYLCFQLIFGVPVSEFIARLKLLS